MLLTIYFFDEEIILLVVVFSEYMISLQVSFHTITIS